MSPIQTTHSRFCVRSWCHLGLSPVGGPGWLASPTRTPVRYPGGAQRGQTGLTGVAADISLFGGSPRRLGGRGGEAVWGRARFLARRGAADNRCMSQTIHNRHVCRPFRNTERDMPTFQAALGISWEQKSSGGRDRRRDRIFARGEDRPAFAWVLGGPGN